MCKLKDEKENMNSKDEKENKKQKITIAERIEWKLYPSSLLNFSAFFDPKKKDNVCQQALSRCKSFFKHPFLQNTSKYSEEQQQLGLYNFLSDEKVQKISKPVIQHIVKMEGWVDNAAEKKNLQKFDDDTEEMTLNTIKQRICENIGDMIETL